MSHKKSFCEIGLAYNPLPQIESFVNKQQRTQKQQAELRSTEGLEEEKIKMKQVGCVLPCSVVNAEKGKH